MRRRPHPIRPVWPPVGAWVVCSRYGHPVAAGRVESSTGSRRIRLVPASAWGALKVDWDHGTRLRVRVVTRRQAWRVMANLRRSVGRGR